MKIKSPQVRTAFCGADLRFAVKKRNEKGGMKDDRTQNQPRGARW